MELWGIILLSLSIVLNGICGYFIFRLRNQVRSMFPDKNLKNLKLDEIFQKYIQKLSEGEVQIDTMDKKLAEYREVSRHFLQDVRFKRFNPFKDTGGDQSFILALLDENKSGVLLTSLHSRDSSRIYAKNIENGKSHMKLSSEEEDVLLSK